MNITVYLGAKEGNDPALKRAVQELGKWIGQSGNALVYGGSKTGLMGEIAKSVLDAGGTVTGVETTLFMQDDLQYDGLTELIVTETITERKTEMIRRGDAFIAFPGGTGTLEEIAEVMSKVSLKQLDAPCILYNLNGYYNGLKTLLDHMIETGLSTKERQEGIWFAENLEQIKQKNAEISPYAAQHLTIPLRRGNILVPNAVRGSSAGRRSFQRAGAAENRQGVPGGLSPPSRAGEPPCAQ